MNNCNAFEELIDRAATDELNGLDRWRLEAHLTGCAACRDQLAETRWIARLVRQEFDETHVATLVAPHRPTKSLARPKLAVAAAASLLLGAAWWMSGSLRPAKQVANNDGAPRTIHGRSFAERKTTLGGRHSIAATDSPATRDNEQYDLAALTAAIDREVSAAELAASAEVLANVSSEYAAESWRLLARTFPETKAGRAAARRLEAAE